MPEPSAPKIRWGILGCSRVFRRRWHSALQQVAAAQVAAIASRSADKARTWARELQIPRSYGDYEELLRDDGVEAVFVGLPNGLHCDWVCRALEAGKHVLCDKPLAISAAEAERMADAAERNGRLLMEGFMYVHHPQYEAIHRWLDEDRIGPVRMIRIGFGFHYDNPGNFRYDPGLGGGALLDLGCYCVHLARQIARAEPRTVSAHSLSHPAGADWSTAAILRFDDGVQAVLDCSFEYEGGRFLHIAGPKGLISSDGPVVSGPAVRLVLKTAQTEQALTIPPQDCYGDFLEAFQRRILERQILPTPARDSIANLRVLDAISNSARLQRPVAVAAE